MQQKGTQGRLNLMNKIQSRTMNLKVQHKIAIVLKSCYVATKVWIEWPDDEIKLIHII